MILRFMPIAAPRKSHLGEIIAQNRQRLLMQESSIVKRAIQHYRLPSRTDKRRIELVPYLFCVCARGGLLQRTPRPAEIGIGTIIAYATTGCNVREQFF